jgi:transcription elongation factor Elf1
MASHSSFADDAALLAWATEALAKATGVRGEADIARHLLAQTTMEAVDRAATDLLGASPAVAAFARELAAKKGLVAASQRERRRRREVKGGAKVERAPLNCLRCGFVNAVTVAARETPAPPDAAYDDIAARLNARRDEWPACGFCGAALAEQVDPAPSPEAEALARRLANYDRESARRTSVVDDQQDWYEVAASPFSTADEAAAAWNKEEARREAAAKRAFTIDIAAGEVHEV